MRTGVRFLRFNLVGVLGFVLQLAVLTALMRGAGLHYLPATALAVGSAVLHNFAWHRRWTWEDRTRARLSAPSSTLARFALANGAVSLFGNLLLMALLVDSLRVPPVLANAVAVSACSVINFWLADTNVFRQTEPRT
jgi:putative flippase GtrA